MKKHSPNGPSNVDCENENHVEYDFVDEMTMDSEGIYAMPYDMELEKTTDCDYIGISQGPQLSAENVHKIRNLELNVSAPITCDCATSDAIEMYTPLSPRGIRWPRQAGNYNHYTCTSHSVKQRPIEFLLTQLHGIPIDLLFWVHVDICPLFSYARIKNVAIL